MAQIGNVSYDGLADGLDVPVGYPASDPGYTGDAFDSGWRNGAMTIKVDDGDVLGGIPDYGTFTQRTNCLHFDSTDGASGALQHDLSNETIMSELFALKVGGTPSADIVIWQLKSGTVVAAQIQHRSNGHLRVRAKYSAIGEGSTVLAANTTYWVRVKALGSGGSGYIELELYDASFTLLEVIGSQNPDFNTEGVFSLRAIGLVNGDTGYEITLGELWWDDADYPAMPSSAVGNVTDTDIELRLSVTTGSAGDSTAQGDPDAALGKYMSTTELGSAINDLFDDVSSAENAALDDEYRCIFVANKHATATWSNVVTWIQSEVSDSPSHALAVDTTGVVDSDQAGAQAVEIADEGSIPAGQSFSAPATKETGLSVGDVGPGQCRAIWLRRTAIGSGVVSGAGVTFRVEGDG